MAGQALLRGTLVDDTGAGQALLRGVLVVEAAGGAISGTASLSFAQGGALTGVGALTGAASIAFAATGALTGAGALVGASIVNFASSGALVGAGALAGAAGFSFTPSGTLSDGLSVIQYISGTARIDFTAAGTVRGIRYSLRAVRINRSALVARSGASRAINRIASGRR